MQTATKNVVKFYGAWVLFWVVVAFVGDVFTPHGEYGISAHLILSITGLPLAFFSYDAPNGTTLGVAVAGAIGLAQWATVAEINGRLSGWWRKRHENT